MPLRKELLDILPNFRQKKAPEHPLVHARFISPKNSVAFYVTAAKPIDVGGYLLRGFIVRPEFRFPIPHEISMLDLDRGKWAGLAPAIEDRSFTMTPWNLICNALFPKPATDSFHRSAPR